MPMLPCCFLSYNEDKPSVVLAASPRMQDHPKREQILSMECSGKGPYWVRLAQGKHNTEEVDIMANKFHAPCPVQSDWIPAAPCENPVMTSLHQEKIVNIACTGGIQTALISVWL